MALTPTGVRITAPTVAARTDWPTDAWRTALPEDQGLDAQRLAQMLDAVQARGLALHSLLVIRNGYLVSETYFGPDQVGTLHESYSVTKSFVVTLVGIAVDQGYIAGIDQRVDEYFPEYLASFDPFKSRITLADLLTMRSGLDWREDDTTITALARSSDWVQFSLETPMAGPPGQAFNYCTDCSHLLSAVVQQATGMNMRQFAEQMLLGPLGISDVAWATDAAGIPIGGWGLRLTPLDMAKLGYLYLQGGRWDGQPVFSAEWVASATHTQAEAGDLGYGYQWWTYPDMGAYAALGRGGQMIFVQPASALIIVTTADGVSHDDILRLIEVCVLPAVTSSSRHPGWRTRGHARPPQSGAVGPTD